jgi:hypothetical protein
VIELYDGGLRDKKDTVKLFDTPDEFNLETGK